MRVTFSLTVRLSRFFGPATRSRGTDYQQRGAVRLGRAEANQITAQVQGSGSQSYGVMLARNPEDPKVLLGVCTCPVSARGEPCKHLWAVLMEIDLRDIVVGPGSGPLELELMSYRGQAISLSPEEPEEPEAVWRQRLRMLRPAAPELPVSPSKRRGSLEYVVQATTRFEAWTGEQLALSLVQVRTRKDGAIGRKAASIQPAEIAGMAPEDRAALAALTGIETAWVDRFGYGPGGYGRDALRGARLGPAAFATVLPALAATGRLGWMPPGSAALAPLRWDGGGGFDLVVRLVKQGRQVAVRGELVRGEERMALGEITAIVCDGLVIAGDQLIAAPASSLGAWIGVLGEPLLLPPGEVPEFLELAGGSPRGPRFDLAELGWETIEVAPIPLLRLGVPDGRGEPFRGRLDMRYGAGVVDRLTVGGIALDGKGKRVVRRDLRAEADAAAALVAAGASIDGDGVVAVSTARFVAVAEDRLAAGWDLIVEGRPLRSGGEVQAKVTSGIDWFDVAVAVEYGPVAAGVPELLSALRSGSPMMALPDGSLGLVPAAWLGRNGALLAHATATGTGKAARFKRNQALVLAAMLDGTPEVDVDAGFGKLRDRLDGFAGVAPVTEPAGFVGELRTYQRDGLGWLGFLRELGFGGCLADDMGLGKTVQVLAMLAARPAERRARTSLVVAPRSVVFNWIDEARRFAPGLRVVEWHGAARHERSDELDDADLVVTTYATLRRDLTALGARELDYLILDEAQAIKNPASQAAQACKLLRAEHRLALTGTPVENHLGDLASIFGFLNPGMLGKVDSLASLAAARGDETAEDAQRIGRVLRPFLLRRTKEQVLTELPGKTEQRLVCRLEGAERKRYDQLRKHYRDALLPRVDRDGVGRSAIHVLEALLRLRQAACHPGLLDPALVRAGSAKLDLLVSQLREVIEAGHRALVFSQFTSLLAIVRSRLDDDGIAYQYLDGKTRDRKAAVDAFQRADGCPVFLISLKAGGSGLNLTAADYVFLLDPWWNPAVESQAIDRVHRIGQDQPVVAYRLVAEDTVEDKVLALQDRKRALFDGLFTDDAGPVARLSADDLRGLLD